MIIRRDGDEWVCTAQVAHARLSGYLAEGWGNADFGQPVARSSVILAANLHDVGWWYAADEYPDPHHDHPDHPVDFREVSVEELRQVYLYGLSLAEDMDVYAALLIARHVETVVESRSQRGKDRRNNAQVRSLLDWQQRHVAALKRQIAPVDYFKAAMQPEIFAANYRLLRVCDLLTLAVCRYAEHRDTISDAPYYGGSAAGRIDLTYTLADHTLRLDPWPFSTPQIKMPLAQRRIPVQTYTEDSLEKIYLKAAVTYQTVIITPDNPRTSADS